MSTSSQAPQSLPQASTQPPPETHSSAETDLQAVPVIQSVSVPDQEQQSRPQSGPPTWLMIASTVALIGLAAVLVFWPGATLLDRLRALDGGICAQLPTHSFFPGGQRLPLCSRNTGIYMGYSITFIALYLRGRLRATEFPRWPIALVLILFILALAVDGFNSLFLDLHLPHLYAPDNLLRLTTGLLTGTAMACFLIPITNVTLWKYPNQQRTMDSWWQLLWMLPILALIFLAVGTQTAIFLYPVAILSSLGVLTVLCMINLTVLIAVTGKACNLTRPRQVFPFVTVGFFLAVGELTALFFLNHWLLQQLTA